MAPPSSPGWVYAETVPRSFVVWAVFGPVATAVVLPLLLDLVGLVPVVGVGGLIGLVGGVVVAEVAFYAAFWNQVLPRGVRVGPDGVGVLTRWGRELSFPWSAVRTRDARWGYGSLTTSVPRLRNRLLSPHQYSAIRSASPELGPDEASRNGPS